MRKLQPRTPKKYQRVLLLPGIGWLRRGNGKRPPTIEALPEGQKLSCITDHPGFKTVVLGKWSLRMAVSRFNTQEKKTYKQTGSEER